MNNLFVIYSYVLRIKSPANKPFFFQIERYNVSRSIYVIDKMNNLLYLYKCTIVS